VLGFYLNLSECTAIIVKERRKKEGGKKGLSLRKGKGGDLNSSPRQLYLQVKGRRTIAPLLYDGKRKEEEDLT